MRHVAANVILSPAAATERPGELPTDVDDATKAIRRGGTR
jgi:hypothetical protein